MNEFDKIDIKQILKMIIDNIIIVIACVVIFGLGFFLYKEFVTVPLYSSSVSLYLNNVDDDMKSGDKVLGTDISASQMLIPSCVEIVKSNRMLNEVAKKDGLDYTAKQIGGMVSAAHIENTEIFTIRVVCANSKDAAIIADTFAKVAPGIITKIIGATSVNVIDFALERKTPINANTTKNIIFGMIIGFIVACAYIILRELFDSRIKNEVDLEKLFDYPILGVIPKIGDKNSGQENYYYRNSFYKSGKGGAYYGSAKKTKG